MAMKTGAVLPWLVFELSGCGLAGGETSSVAVPSDGVGNFGETSLLEVCLGAARVTSPSAASAAGAVCVKAGTAGRPCAADSGCDGIERCICGRCIVLGCQGAVSCGPGRACRNRRCTTACAADADCLQGERCVTGGCARRCSSDAGCHHGERCDALDNVCAAKLCSEAIPCGTGDTCEAEQITGELHEPEIAEIDGAPVAFIEIRRSDPGLMSAIYRARIEGNGRCSIDPQEPVLAGDASGRVGAPSILARDERLELYFALGEGTAIGRAISIDGGRSFTREGSPVLEPSVAWEKGWIGSPAVVLRGSQALLFYEGGPRAGIGVARVAADGFATRLGEGPVVAAAQVEDPLFWRGVTEVGAPFAQIHGDALRLYFTARGAEAGDARAFGASLPAERNDSIGLFTTRDLMSFAPYPAGPVFARTANLRAHLGEREAVVRLPPSGAEITFVATDASGTEVSGLAQARAGRP
jgi:hypothetical protein